MGPLAGARMRRSSLHADQEDVPRFQYARKLRAEGKSDRERALEYARALRIVIPTYDDDAIIQSCTERGDLAPLLRLLRSASALSPKVRSLTADLLEGKVRRRRARPTTIETTWEERRRVHLVFLLEWDGWSKRTAAIAQAADALCCSKRAVQAALQRHEVRMRELFDTYERELDGSAPEPRIRRKASPPKLSTSKRK
jgi:hypothetical protein